MIYYESPQAKVSWNESIKTVILEWKAFAQGEQFRTLSNKVLEILGQKHSNKILFDSRKLSVIPADDQKWIVEE